MFSSVSRLQYPKALGKDRDKNLAGLYLQSAAVIPFAAAAAAVLAGMPQ